MKKLNALILTLFVFVLVVVSCGDDDEPTVTFANPTITITSPSDLSGLTAVIGSPISFTLEVSAEAGLSSLSLNGMNIKTYTGQEITDAFEYTFTSSESGALSLVFVVTDAEGTSTESDAVALIVEEGATRILDFGGETTGMTFTQNADCDGQEQTGSAQPARVATEFESVGITTTPTYEASNDWYRTAEGEESAMSLVFTAGQDNPDPNAAEEFQGSTMAYSKKYARWSWDRSIISLDNMLDVEDVDALPQINSDLNGLTEGTKVIKLDAYYMDTQEAPFDSVKVEEAGYRLDIILVDYNVHKCNHDGSGMYIGYSAYITSANTWETITFDQLYIQGGVNNYLSVGGNNSPDSDGIDGISMLFGINSTYDLGSWNWDENRWNNVGPDNTTFFRNLRIEDVE